MKSSSLIHQYIVLFLVVPFLFISCEKDKSGTIDFSLSPPFVSESRLDHYSINSDTIRINTQLSLSDTIPISNRIQVKVSDPNGPTDIKNVRIQIFRPNSTKTIVTGYLNDKGTSGDIIPNDGIYSSSFSFKTPRQLIGMFTIEIQAEDNTGLVSNTLSQKMNVYTQLKPPLIYNLKAPDSVALPASGSTIIQMSIVAYDSNGLGDIQEVYFRSLDSSDPTYKHMMFDNGNISVYGDSVAGDGIYSIKIQLPFNMTPKPYRFEFEARDFTALLSNKIIHILHVISP
ncbi:MAG: hypothetical protein KKF20_01460 [Bacteroidetes bacterium]|nr:hypothetical protein [Bacteroidota bacterium]MBU1421981.1 hypothetical protein [Bacteroidota bacterium]MBU2471061.1 hypothetical protein [Bacteroidota bacterium]